MKCNVSFLSSLMTVFIVLGCATYTQAQTKFDDYPFDTTSTYIIELMDGSEFIGKFLSKDNGVVVIQTTSIPRLEIPLAQIKSVRTVSEGSIKNGNYWFPNPNDTRYLFAPSAFNLKKGAGYYQNSYLVLNSVNYGVTNNFSIGVSIEAISLFSSLADGRLDPIVLVTPKLGFEVSEKLHAGVGLLYLNVPGFDNSKRSGGGIVYGLSTYGNRDDNITGGLGWGFIEGETSKKPVINFSGMKRLTRTFSLVTENWFVPISDDFGTSRNYYGVYSYGIRFFGKRMSVDLAFINNRDFAEYTFIGIPYVDFVVTF